MFIFIDESGDLGFDWSKHKTSPYFTIALLVCESSSVAKEFSRAVKHTLRRKLNRKPSKRKVVELKGTNTTIEVKRYFYDHVPSKGWAIYSVTLNKERVNKELQTKQGKKKLYNFLARFMIDKIAFPKKMECVNLVVDRCKNAEETKDFNCYIEQHLQGKLPLPVPLYISHESSQENACLQAVDLFCWGIARKWRDQDEEWFKSFARKVRVDEMYLPDPKKK